MRRLWRWIRRQAAAPSCGYDAISAEARACHDRTCRDWPYCRSEF